MSRISDQRIALLGLIVAVFSCVGTYLAIPEILFIFFGGWLLT